MAQLNRLVARNLFRLCKRTRAPLDGEQDWVFALPKNVAQRCGCFGTVAPPPIVSAGAMNYPVTNSASALLGLLDTPLTQLELMANARRVAP